MSAIVLSRPSLLSAYLFHPLFHASLSFLFITFRFHALCLPLPFSFYAFLSSLRPFLSTKTAYFVLRSLKKYSLSTK